MTVRGLCLVITDKCNAACDVCCFRCVPENSHVMDEGLMTGLIDQAARIEGVRYIGFSGGEPFLYYDLLQKGLRYAREKGFATSVATNGFWGAWPDDVLIERLSGLAADKIFFSTDYYHRQFVPDEAVGRAITAARALNLEISVGIGETVSHPASEHFRQMGDYKYLMSFYTYAFVRAGRAEALPEAEFFPARETPVAHCVSGALVSTLYDGRVFPCCEQQVFDTALELGNALDTPLEEIFSSPDNNALMNALESEEGFARLVEAARGARGAHGAHGACGACEACGRYFRRSAGAPDPLPVLREAAARAAVDRLMGRCAK